MIKRKGRPPRRMVTPAERAREEFMMVETPKREIELETIIKSKLIIPPNVKKIEISQEEVVPSRIEEIPAKEGVIEKVVSAPEEIPAEEQVKEEVVVSTPEEILVEEEKIVIDTIEVPKIERISCPICGMKLSSGVIFCLRCGHKLKK